MCSKKFARKWVEGLVVWREICNFAKILTIMEQPKREIILSGIRPTGNRTVSGFFINN